jgi:hypothetical protein
MVSANMRLPGVLGRYQLLPACDLRGLRHAITASLRILKLGFPAISFPLLAATFPAVFGNADFSLHLFGETGTFKSAFVALFQQHYGAQMDRSHLPGGWSSTANSLEATAFLAKDAIFVIDDFAPQGSTMDIANYTPPPTVSSAQSETKLVAAGSMRQPDYGNPNRLAPWCFRPERKSRWVNPSAREC